MQKILIIDDDTELLNLLENFFKGKGFFVVLLNSGVNANEVAVKEQPDIILLDVRMPGADGFTVLKRLKENGLTSHIPVIMLTGEDTPDSQISGLLTGADDYITKPFDLEVLYARVLAGLRKSAEHIRTKKDQLNLLNFLINHYIKRGYEVYSKLHPDFPDYPEGWKGYVPDMIIRKGYKTKCYSFENIQSLKEESFIDRLKALVTLGIENEIEPEVIVRTKEAKKFCKEICKEYNLPIKIKLIKRHKRLFR